MLPLSFQVCFGLVLIYVAGSAYQLPLPSPADMVDSVKVLLMDNLDDLINNLVPAISIALIIRKLTS
jgi:hypothetical protein